MAESRFDLRTSLVVERRLLPALLLIGLVAAASASAVGAQALVWGWFALHAANSAARFLLATAYGDVRRPIGVDARSARQYLACAVADVALWGLLLALVPRPVAFVAGPGAFAASGAVLLAALSFGGWPRVWTFYVAAWVGVFALVAVRTNGTLTSFAFAFPLWLLAVWWLGRQQPLSRHAERRAAAQTLISNPTKFGWQAAIHAIPTPVIVARNGRIIEVNRSACEFIGRSERSILGNTVEECLVADPPQALQPERHRSESSVQVEIRPAGRTFDGALWSGRVRYMEPGRATSIIVIALSQAVQEPFGPSRLIEDARRFAEWAGGLQGLPWYRDERGALIVPQEFPTPDASTEAIDAAAFPLAYLLAVTDQERVNSLYRDCMKSGGLFDERLSLRDVQGGMREVRVVCMARPSGADGLAPVIGSIAAAKPLPVRAPTEPLTDLLSRLPVVVWLVDSAGRLLHATGSEPRRWGMVAEARTRPEWQKAFAFRPESMPAVQLAIQKALAGQPSYDIRNARTSLSGGILSLRSHFVPYSGKQLQAVLVMDTIASPHELLEIDHLKRRKAQYKSLVEASASLIWACDQDFTLTFASRRAARSIYGYETRELLGRSANILLPTDAEQPAVRRAFEGLREGRAIRDLEAVHIKHDGHRVIVSISAVPLRHPDGRFAGAVGMNADLTALKSRETRLSEALRVERTVLDSAGQAIAVVKQGLVQRCNDAFLGLAGLPPAQLAQTPLREFLMDGDDWNELTVAADEARSRDQAVVRELRVRRGARLGNGEGAAWCQVTARSIADGESVLVIADIDTIKRREASALHEAQHDDLTGLPNRRLLAERAAAALATSELRKVSCAVMAIDLDGFKEVNDRYGHEIGDDTLREIATRLTRVMRPQDTVARRGGDEFAVLVPDVGSMVEVERIATRLLQAVAQPVTHQGRPTLGVSASIGISLAPEQGRDLERLLQLADLAMYDAKLKGKNRFAFAQGAGLPANVTQLVPRASRAT